MPTWKYVVLDGKRELAFIGEQEPLLFDFAADRKKKQKASIMTNAQIRQALAETTDMEDSKRYGFNNEIHRRYAFSMACLALSMVAVPLGIQARRKETSTGLAISILVGLCYFLFFMVADSFEKKPGNTACYSTGCLMLHASHLASSFLQSPQKITKP